MNGFIKVWKTISRRSGKPMFSSAYSFEVDSIGRAFQGGGSDDDKPWFIMITKVRAETLEDVMWFNPTTGKLITETQYGNLDQSAPTGDSVDESTGEVRPD